MSELKDISIEFFKKRFALQSYLFGLLGDAHLVEDVMQEVWVKLADKVESGEKIENIGAWSRGTARNIVLHHWRDSQKAKVIADSEILDLIDLAYDENPQIESEFLSRRGALMKCLQIQPEKSRRLLKLKYEDNLSFQLMSEKLGQSSSSLMMAVSRIRKALGNCIEKRMKAELI